MGGFTVTCWLCLAGDHVASECPSLDRARQMRANVDEEIDRVTQISTDLLAALKEVEWAGPEVDGIGFCPCCGRCQKQEHGSECVVGNAIARAGALC